MAHRHSYSLTKKHSFKEVDSLLGSYRKLTEEEIFVEHSKNRTQSNSDENKSNESSRGACTNSPHGTDGGTAKERDNSRSKDIKRKDSKKETEKDLKKLKKDMKDSKKIKCSRLGSRKSKNSDNGSPRSGSEDSRISVHSTDSYDVEMRLASTDYESFNMPESTDNLQAHPTKKHLDEICFNSLKETSVDVGLIQNDKRETTHTGNDSQKLVDASLSLNVDEACHRQVGEDIALDLPNITGDDLVTDLTITKLKSRSRSTSSSPSSSSNSSKGSETDRRQIKNKMQKWKSDFSESKSNNDVKNKEVKHIKSSEKEPKNKIPKEKQETSKSREKSTDEKGKNKEAKKQKSTKPHKLKDAKNLNSEDTSKRTEKRNKNVNTTDSGNGAVVGAVRYDPISMSSSSSCVNISEVQDVQMSHEHGFREMAIDITKTHDSGGVPSSNDTVSKHRRSLSSKSSSSTNSETDNSINPTKPRSNEKKNEKKMKVSEPKCKKDKNKRLEVEDEGKSTKTEPGNKSPKLHKEKIKPKTNLKTQNTTGMNEQVKLVVKAAKEKTPKSSNVKDTKYKTNHEKEKKEKWRDDKKDKQDKIKKNDKKKKDKKSSKAEKTIDENFPICESDNKTMRVDLSPQQNRALKLKRKSSSSSSPSSESDIEQNVGLHNKSHDVSTRAELVDSFTQTSDNELQVPEVATAMNGSSHESGTAMPIVPEIKQNTVTEAPNGNIIMDVTMERKTLPKTKKRKLWRISLGSPKINKKEHAGSTSYSTSSPKSKEKVSESSSSVLSEPTKSEVRNQTESSSLHSDTYEQEKVKNNNSKSLKIPDGCKHSHQTYTKVFVKEINDSDGDVFVIPPFESLEQEGEHDIIPYSLDTMTVFDANTSGDASTLPPDTPPAYAATRGSAIGPSSLEFQTSLVGDEYNGDVDHVTVSPSSDHIFSPPQRVDIVNNKDGNTPSSSSDDEVIVHSLKQHARKSQTPTGDIASSSLQRTKSELSSSSSSDSSQGKNTKKLQNTTSTEEHSQIFPTFEIDIACHFPQLSRVDSPEESEQNITAKSENIESSLSPLEEEKNISVTLTSPKIETAGPEENLNANSDYKICRENRPDFMKETSGSGVDKLNSEDRANIVASTDITEDTLNLPTFHTRTESISSLDSTEGHSKKKKKKTPSKSRFKYLKDKIFGTSKVKVGKSASDSFDTSSVSSKEENKESRTNSSTSEVVCVVIPKPESRSENPPTLSYHGDKQDTTDVLKFTQRQETEEQPTQQVQRKKSDSSSSSSSSEKEVSEKQQNVIVHPVVNVFNISATNVVPNISGSLDANADGSKNKDESVEISTYLESKSNELSHSIDNIARHTKKHIKPERELKEDKDIEIPNQEVQKIHCISLNSTSFSEEESRAKLQHTEVSVDSSLSTEKSVSNSSRENSPDKDITTLSSVFVNLRTPTFYPFPSSKKEKNIIKIIDAPKVKATRSKPDSSTLSSSKDSQRGNINQSDEIHDPAGKILHTTQFTDHVDRNKSDSSTSNYEDSKEKEEREKLKISVLDTAKTKQDFTVKKYLHDRSNSNSSSSSKSSKKETENIDEEFADFCLPSEEEILNILQPHAKLTITNSPENSSEKKRDRKTHKISENTEILKITHSASSSSSQDPTDENKDKTIEVTTINTEIISECLLDQKSTASSSSDESEKEKVIIAVSNTETHATDESFVSVFDDPVFEKGNDDKLHIDSDSYRQQRMNDYLTHCVAHDSNKDILDEDKEHFIDDGNVQNIESEKQQYIEEMQRLINDLDNNKDTSSERQREDFTKIVVIEQPEPTDEDSMSTGTSSNSSKSWTDKEQDYQITFDSFTKQLPPTKIFIEDTACQLKSVPCQQMIDISHKGECPESYIEPGLEKLASSSEGVQEPATTPDRPELMKALSNAFASDIQKSSEIMDEDPAVENEMHDKPVSLVRTEDSPVKLDKYKLHPDTKLEPQQFLDEDIASERNSSQNFQVLFPAKSKSRSLSSTSKSLSDTNHSAVETPISPPSLTDFVKPVIEIFPSKTSESDKSGTTSPKQGSEHFYNFVESPRIIMSESDMSSISAEKTGDIHSSLLTNDSSKSEPDVSHGSSCLSSTRSQTLDTNAIPDNKELTSAELTEMGVLKTDKGELLHPEQTTVQQAAVNTLGSPKMVITDKETPNEVSELKDEMATGNISVLDISRKEVEKDDTSEKDVSCSHSPNLSSADVKQTLSFLDNAIVKPYSHVNIVHRTPSFLRSRQGYFVVVAIDFGTTFSGYALSFTHDPNSIHMMRKWEDDPGILNQKTPTTMLLTPEGKFDSFGLKARNTYYDLEPHDAKKWLYFEKFKMLLHHNSNLSKETKLKASNGKEISAMLVFSYALKFFRDHALKELNDQSVHKIISDDIRWVITVPAIWKAPAKHFMRQAAYQAGIASSEHTEQLLIALEPEAASIYCRTLKTHQLAIERPLKKPLQSPSRTSPEPINLEPAYVCNLEGTRYVLVDCGGGTVDITVHEIDKDGKLTELFKATGGAYGGIGVDNEFEKLLCDIFGSDFIEQFKLKRPAGWVDLMIAFESRKRSASPYECKPLNISLPFSFFDCYKKTKGGQVENIVKKFADKNIRWSPQGMLRLNPEAMRRLFLPTMDKIKHAIGDILNNRNTRNLQYLFLVGGFAESPILQQEVRREFGNILKIIIPQDVGLTILKGAVMFGLDPTIVNIRHSRLIYGVGVLNRFNPEKHPKSKKVSKDEVDWCTDVFDRFVDMDEPITLGDTVVRSYTPARPGQKLSLINIYCSEQQNVQFITDTGVRKCGMLSLNLTDVQHTDLSQQREIQIQMHFGETEIRVTAVDKTTGREVLANIDFLNR